MDRHGDGFRLPIPTSELTQMIVAEAGALDLYVDLPEGVDGCTDYFTDRNPNVKNLNAHLEQVPVLIIPCIAARTDGEQTKLWGIPPITLQNAQWGSIAPAAWSFMLAARARWRGKCWTSLHLFFEEEVAKLLGIPYAEVMQACLIPLAYTKGTEFKPGRRDPLHTVVHWESW
jgi:nitroreductase